MTPLQNIKKEILNLLTQILDSAMEISESQLESPPEPTWGDFAFPCYNFAKELKKSPPEIASDLAKKISLKLDDKSIISKVEARGPYINFFINKFWLAKEVIPEIIKKQEKYGDNKLGQGKKVMVEYVSPNTNKPLHLGHIRNAALGWSVAKILEKSKFKVVKSILINDRGIHICKSMLAYQKWGLENAEKNLKSDFLVGKYYVMFSQKVKDEPKLQEEAQEMLKKWEMGDKEILALWKKMNQWAINGHNETYKKLGIGFDQEYLESDLYLQGKEIVQEGLKKGIFKEQDGAVMVELEPFGLPNKILQRSDGTSIYMTQDLYLAVKKVKDYQLDISIYVVGSEQDLHFKQLFKILELLGYSWAKNCYHLSYGLVYLPEGKMKSREGTVVDADNFIKELEEMAQKELAGRYPDLVKKELLKRSSQIALGAIKYYMLQVDPKSDMHFNPKESLAFAGHTGPYLQYTYARINSILKKAEKLTTKKLDFTQLQEQKEGYLIFMLAKYPEVIEDSVKKYDPSTLAKYLFDLTQEFNNYYHKHQVLKAEKEVMLVRLALIQAVQIVIKDGLELLGIEAPEEM